MTPPTLDPLAAYTERLAVRQAAVWAYETRIDGIGQLRVVAFGIMILSAGVLWISGLASLWWATIGGLIFFGLFLYSKSLTYRKFQAQRAVRYYAHGLDRLAEKWAGRGPTGLRFANPEHLYAADLDLFGDGSLFQRLCSARTVEGENRLAAWLLAPAPAIEVRDRQQAVHDLRNHLDLREFFSGIGASVNEAADLAPLVEWGQRPAANWPRWRSLTIFILGWFNLFAVLGWLLAGTTSIPVLIGGIISIFVVWPLIHWVREVTRPVEEAANDLPLLEAILTRLEQEPFTSPRLKTLQSSLVTDHILPSAQVRELRTLIEWATARRNPFFFPFALTMLWDVQMALRLETWRVRSGLLIERWLNAVAELEALGSLAGYAFECPNDPFPELLPDGSPRFEALGLGHPLLPANRCVRNDVQIGGSVQLLMVSGSNMSGKSTLLRAIGTNVVLALAGAPVRAERLCVNSLTLGATIRIQDSLQDGRSRFFAEITRVRAVLDQSSRVSLLFLFDELFSGTNSADRLVGAQGVLQTLLDRGAAGLVTTHDLALTEAASRLGERAVNVHFEDQLDQGTMVFDYRMRPGVVPHGNGVALMRAVGLQI